MGEIKQELLKTMITTKGRSIYDISYQKPCLLIFLRHFGCMFCREALHDLKILQQNPLKNEFEIVLVHMSSMSIAENFFKKMDLGDIENISDPDCELYQSFGLTKGTFNQLFGFRSWIRGFDAGLVKGHGFGVLLGDGFQMPGVFTIQNGKVTNSFIHKYSSDKPDYLQLALQSN